MACQGCSDKKIRSVVGEARTFTFPLKDLDLEILVRGTVRREHLSFLQECLTVAYNVIQSAAEDGERMETVDPAALDELERRAQAADGLPPPAPAEKPTPTPEPFPPRAPQPAPTPDPTLTPVWKVGADGKLEALVEAAAVEKKLATFEATLFRMQAQLQHTMLLVMTLADHGRITPDDYDRALAQMRQAEQGRR